MHEQNKIRYLPYLIIFHEIAIYLSNDMYLPSMPTIANDLHLTQDQTQSTLTMWFFGASALQFILGPLSDRFGRKSIIVFGGISYIISSLTCAIVSDLPIFLLARFVQGTAVCSVLVAGYAAIHELFNTKDAIKILAIMGAIIILAPAFGPLVGALIVQFYNWRYIFWLLFIMGSISTLLLIAFMPESNKNRRNLHLPTITKGYYKIIFNMDFMLPCLSYCLLCAISYLWIFEAPFLMIEVYGYTPVYYGISQASIFGCFFFGAALLKYLLERYTLSAIINISTIVSFFICILFIITAKLFNNMLLSVLCLMGISTVTSVLFGPLNRLAIDASSQPMGSRTAVFSTILNLFGALIGSLLMLVQITNLTKAAVIITGFMGLAMLLIMFLTQQRHINN